MTLNYLKRVAATSAMTLVIMCVSTSETQAQMGGYQLGTGLNFAQNRLQFNSPREDLPYFAKFPPVYYGNMVRRPYGFSPYALPPGIMPVESKIIDQRQAAKTIMNPFFTPAVETPMAPPAPEEKMPSELKDDGDDVALQL